MLLFDQAESILEGDRWKEILGSWKDTYPKPVVKIHKGFRVVRDDLLSLANGPAIGSKARFADALFFHYPHIREWVYGSSPAQGFAQVSLAAAANTYGINITLFMAERSKENRTPQQKTALSLGADIRWVPNGFLAVTESRAKAYASELPEKRRLIPMGLDHPVVLSAIIKVARSLKLRDVREIWTVAGSGTLSRGLQMAFPDAFVHAVSVGHRLTEEQRGRAKVWEHPLPFTKDVPEKDIPPYPSLRNYDAKLWMFAKKHARPGALIWNVA